MRVCNYMYVRKALILCQVTIHCLIMWRAIEQLRGLYKDSKMSGEKNHTIDAQESLSVTESLNLCKKLLEHGWMSAHSMQLMIDEVYKKWNIIFTQNTSNTDHRGHFP